jgi:L-ascorbate metabolism protein UlaG (beta-lactamase superfamily)
VLVVHCGAVRFPRVPLLGRALFTFTPAEVVELCRLADPRVIVPVHRSGWTHFQPESEVRAALDGAGFGERVRWLEVGESTTVSG